MELHNTPIDAALRRIVSNGEANTNYAITMEIFYDALGKKSIIPLIVSGVTIARDYIEDFADTITVKLTTGYGDFARLIYPNAKNLRVGIRFSLSKDLITGKAPDSIDEHIVMKAFLTGEYASPTVGQGRESNTQEALNLSSLIDFTLHLIPFDVLRLKTIQCGTNLRKSKPQSIAVTLLTKAIGQNADKENTSVKYLDVIDFDNTDVVETMAIHASTYAHDLVDYLQDKVGCYNAGAGSYIQDHTWYIYPLFDTKRHTSAVKTVVFYIIPREKYRGLERTWMLEGDQLSVLVTGRVQFKDDNATNYIQAGNGTRYLKPDKAVNPVSTKGGKALYDRNGNCNEYISDKAVEGINHAPWQKSVISGNPFKAASELAFRRGGILTLEWGGGMPEYILPAMPTKVYYMDGTEMKQLYGTVLAAKHYYVKPGGFATSLFMTQSIINIFVNNQVSDPRNVSKE